jgi:hypothetical protein
MAGVAQLVRALGCGSRGRGFDPRRLPHLVFFTSINYRKLSAQILCASTIN